MHICAKTRMKIAKNICSRTLLLCFLVLTLPSFADTTGTVTQVAMLGTGTPNPFPERSGPGVAIVVNDEAYLVDFGAGVVRRAASLSPEYGGEIPGLAVEKLNHAFLTHLHSDHSVGLPDLLLTSWVAGRDRPLRLFGPEGTASMAKNIIAAYEEDIRYRLYSDQPANNQGWRIDTSEVTQTGVIFKDNNVTVEAFRVPHGSWPDAWGYRFTTPDKVIVISGDTAPSERLLEYAKGADILIHEVYSLEGFQKKEPRWQKYHAGNHTSTHELGALAVKARPKLLVLYHQLLWGSSHETLLREVREIYDGEVVSARDLDVY